MGSSGCGFCVGVFGDGDVDGDGDFLIGGFGCSVGDSLVGLVLVAAGAGAGDVVAGVGGAGLCWLAPLRLV